MAAALQTTTNTVSVRMPGGIWVSWSPTCREEYHELDQVCSDSTLVVPRLGSGWSRVPREDDVFTRLGLGEDLGEPGLGLLHVHLDGHVSQV
jgi:hypothetical protein